VTPSGIEPGPSDRIIGDIAAGRGGMEIERPAAPPLSKLAEEWLKRREATHKAWRDDRNRWSKRLGPFFGHKLPDEVNVADVRRFVEGIVAAGLSPATARLCVALLGSLYTDLVERELVAQNVVRALPRAVRRARRLASSTCTRSGEAGRAPEGVRPARVAHPVRLHPATPTLRNSSSGAATSAPSASCSGTRPPR
jgi:hypothetical protein